MSTKTSPAEHAMRLAGFVTMPLAGFGTMIVSPEGAIFATWEDAHDAHDRLEAGVDTSLTADFRS